MSLIHSSFVFIQVIIHIIHKLDCFLRSGRKLENTEETWTDMEKSNKPQDQTKDLGSVRRQRYHLHHCAALKQYYIFIH